SLPKCRQLRLGSSGHSLLSGPKKTGQEKREHSAMSYLNSITLVGFVGSDPEPHQAEGNGSKFTVLSVATQRSWKNADDEWSSKVEWHRAAIISNLAPFQPLHGKKGRRQTRLEFGSIDRAKKSRARYESHRKLLPRLAF